MHRYTDNYWKRVHLSLESSRYRIWKQAALALSKKRRERESQTLFCHDSTLSLNHSATKDRQSAHGIQPYFTSTTTTTDNSCGSTRNSQNDVLSGRLLLEAPSIVENSIYTHEKEYLGNLQQTTSNLKEYHRDRNCNLTSVRAVGGGSPTNGACDGALAAVERRMNTNGRGAMTRSSTPTTSAESRPVAWGHHPSPHTPPRPSHYSSGSSVSRPPPQERPGVEVGHSYLPGSSSSNPLFGSSSQTPDHAPVQQRIYHGEYPPTLTTTTPVFSPLAVYPYQYPSHITYQTSLLRRVQEQQQQQQQSLPHARPSYPFPTVQPRNLSPPPGLASVPHSAYNLPSQQSVRSRPYLDPHRVTPPPPPPPREDRYIPPSGSGGPPHASTQHFKVDPSRTDLFKNIPRFERPLVRRGPSIGGSSSSSEDYLKHTVKSEAPLPKIRHTELVPGPGSASSSSHHQHHHHHLHPPQSYGTSATTSTSSVTSAQSTFLHPPPHQHHHLAHYQRHHQAVHHSQASPASQASSVEHQHQTAASTPTQPHYPPHFMKGSVIQLANGDLKRVEDLRTEDFVHSADISTDLKIDSSQVVHIEEMPDRGTAILGFSVGPQKIRVTVEATLEHPFFVFGQGWSSCSPDKTRQHYDLQCHKLVVGDICISLTQRQSLPSSTSPNVSTSAVATITTNGQHPMPPQSSRQRDASPQGPSPSRSPQEDIVEVEKESASEDQAGGYRLATGIGEAGSISGNHGNSSGSSNNSASHAALLSGQPKSQGTEGKQDFTTSSGECRRTSRDYLEDEKGEALQTAHLRKRRRSSLTVQDPAETFSGTDEGPIDVTDSSSSSSANAHTPDASTLPSTSEHYSSGIL